MPLRFSFIAILLLGRQARLLTTAIARSLHIIVRLLDMRVLSCQELVNRQRRSLLQRILICPLRGVLTLLGGFQQRVIAASQMRLNVAPGAVNRTAYTAALLRVLAALAIQQSLQLAPEL
jgi:hypothetical protein